MDKSIVLDGEGLELHHITQVARQKTKVCYSDEVISRLKGVRDWIDNNWLGGQAPPIYGFNTGVGNRKNEFIGKEDLDLYQKLYIGAHSVGTGDPFAHDIVRAAMLLRANSFAKGFSGVTIELAQMLLDVLNRGVVPFVPSQGSVGASGDLCPLAHISFTL